MTLAHTI